MRPPGSNEIPDNESIDERMAPGDDMMVLKKLGSYDFVCVVRSFVE